MAVDGIIATDSYWSCAFSPSSLTVDLGEPQPVEAVRVVNYWDGTRFYQYRVELSTDGSAWSAVADMSQNTVPATDAGTVHRFARQAARYVRVTMLHNSANPGMHIAEMQAFSQVPP
jgi:alpha-N-acetylglucosaminidase